MFSRQLQEGAAAAHLPRLRGGVRRHHLELGARGRAPVPGADVRRLDLGACAPLAHEARRQRLRHRPQATVFTMGRQPCSTTLQSLKRTWEPVHPWYLKCAGPRLGVARVLAAGNIARSLTPAHAQAERHQGQQAAVEAAEQHGNAYSIDGNCRYTAPLFTHPFRVCAG